MIGLGCMRLSTAKNRDDARSLAVLTAALDAGVELLDTADAYALDDRDVGHNERLIAQAITGRKAYVAPRLASHGNLEDMVASPVENGSPRGFAVVAGYRTF